MARFYYRKRASSDILSFNYAGYISQNDHYVFGTIQWNAAQRSHFQNAITKIACSRKSESSSSDIIRPYRFRRFVVTRSRYVYIVKKRKEKKKRKRGDIKRTPKITCFLANAVLASYVLITRERVSLLIAEGPATDECVFYRQRASHSGDRNLFWLSCVTWGWVARFPLVCPLRSLCIVGGITYFHGEETRCVMSRWIFLKAHLDQASECSLFPRFSKIEV